MTLPLTHFKNALLQGRFGDSGPEGFGILALDSGTLVIGTWRRGVLQGPFFCALGPEEFVFGQAAEGKQEGIACFINSFRVVIGKYREDKPEGKFIQISKTKLSARVIDADRKIVLSSCGLQSYSDKIIKLVLEKINAPSYLPGLNRQHYDPVYFLRGMALEVEELEHLRIDDLDYFGFSRDNRAEGLGLSFAESSRVATIGEFRDNDLEGHTQVYSPGEFHFEGGMKGGRLSGEGVTYRENENRWELQMFENGSLVIQLRQGIGFPTNEVKRLRKEQHLKQVGLQRAYIRFQVPPVPSFQHINEDKPRQVSPVRLRSKERPTKQDFVNPPKAKERYIQPAEAQDPEEQVMRKLRTNLLERQTKSPREEPSPQRKKKLSDMLKKPSTSVAMVKNDRTVDRMLKEISVSLVEREEFTERSWTGRQSYMLEGQSSRR